MSPAELERLGKSKFPHGQSKQMVVYAGWSLDEVYRNRDGHTWMRWFAKQMTFNELEHKHVEGDMNSVACNFMRTQSKYKKLRAFVDVYFPQDGDEDEDRRGSSAGHPHRRASSRGAQ
eukprot:CAMPEP_0198207362 /NCGR_PEP_ID=MMETSP1445-20131203/10822_1 /TAXON_ID=36898 /ORGANISM="Pyramimonas sp., Strain CCMP2087" /LENGTH=117 /DNA_ID=CAMNT_0043880363 /DNA_START=145 /DNA_END=498 /DNA_ORIENTATION=-